MSKLTVGVYENNKVPLRFLFFVWQRRQIVINHYMPWLLNDRLVNKKKRRPAWRVS